MRKILKASLLNSLCLRQTPDALTRVFALQALWTVVWLACDLRVTKVIQVNCACLAVSMSERELGQGSYRSNVNLPFAGSRTTEALPGRNSFALHSLSLGYQRGDRAKNQGKRKLTA